MERSNVEKQRREKLINEKPYVMNKLFNYENKRAKGEATPIIEIIYDHQCNMKCAHCSNAGFAIREKAITVADIKKLAKQADDLGLAQFSISGGEPLMFPDLDEIVAAIDPQKFHISISTNGTLMDREMAKHLKDIGVDKVKISVDSISKEIYAKTRGTDRTYNQALLALENAKEAGLQVVVQTVVSHQNCISENTERLALFCQENEFNMDVLIARAIGNWEGREDVLIDERDAEYLVELNKKYPAVHRDTFPTYGDEEGSCGTVRRLLCVTKYGDVMPCVLIHIAIGNIFDETLEEIINRGLSIKHFANPNRTCLSGEDRGFIGKYMSKFYGKELPVSWEETFTEEDFIEKL